MINQGSALDRALHHDDMNAARELIEAIERQGLQMKYTTYLAGIVGVHRSSWDNRETLLAIPWLLLRATPEQHCRAFIACTQGDTK